jgi:paraquat-inducible protein A
MELNNCIACHDCDWLIKLPDKIPAGQRVCCPHCDAKQFTVRRDPINKAIAISLSALCLMVLAVSFPFLAIETQGLSHSISLIESPLALYQQGYAMIGFIVLACVIVLPSLFLLNLVAMMVSLLVFGKNRLSLFHAKIIDALRPWIMADVFVLAILVALIKLIESANVILGAAFWAYIAFAITFVLTTTIVTKRQLWYWAEHGK